MSTDLERAYGRLRASLAKLMLACGFPNSEDPDQVEALADTLDERAGAVIASIGLLRHEARRAAARHPALTLSIPVDQADGAGAAHSPNPFVKLAVVAFLLLFVSAAGAQTVALTATQLGGPATPYSGTLIVTPTWCPGAASFRAYGGGQTSALPIKVPVVSGTFSVVLNDPSIGSPANSGWSLSTPTHALAGYSCVQVSPAWCAGGVCNLDNYIPSVPALAPAQPFVVTINGIAGALTFTGSVSCNATTLTCNFTGGGSMTWPTGGAGIPNYNGSSAWGTSYSASNQIPASFIATLNQSTTGTAANITATSNSTLASLPSLSLPYSQLTGTPTLPQTIASASHKWLNSYTAGTGMFTETQPSCEDLSDSGSACNQASSAFDAAGAAAAAQSNAEAYSANAGNLASGTVNAARLPSTVAQTNQANTYTAGYKQTFASSASTAGMSFAGVTADPSGAGAGDAWYRSDTGRWSVYASAVQRVAYLSDIPSALPPNGSAGGDLSGTYPSPSVAGLKGLALPTLAAQTGYLYDNNGVLALQTPSGSGNVNGSGSSTANNFAAMNNTTSTAIKDSGYSASSFDAAGAAAARAAVESCASGYFLDQTSTAGGGSADCAQVNYSQLAGTQPNPRILGYTLQRSESGAADSNLLTVTPPASAGVYQVCWTLDVSAASSATIGFTASWKDANGTAQSPTNLSTFKMTVAAPALTFTTSAAGNFSGCYQIDTDNSATNIVVAMTWSGTSMTAKASAWVQKLI